MNKKGTFDVIKAKQAQYKLCEENNYPNFAPGSGVCWKCHKNIYKPIGWKVEKLPNGLPIKRVQVPIGSTEMELITGITVEKASKELVTGCPHCHKSYCD